jgi:hypothetical protein
MGPVRDRDVLVALQQLDRVHHRAVGGVVGAELQCSQQIRQQTAVVMGVGTAQHGADLAVEHRPLGLGLPGQLPQRRFPDQRVDHLPDRLVRVRDRRLRDPVQDPRLACHPLQIVGQFFLDPPLSPGVNLQHELDE